MSSEGAISEITVDIMSIEASAVEESGVGETDAFAREQEATAIHGSYASEDDTLDPDPEGTATVPEKNALNLVILPRLWNHPISLKYKTHIFNKWGDSKNGETVTTEVEDGVDAEETPIPRVPTPSSPAEPEQSWEPPPGLTSRDVSQKSIELFRAALNGDWKLVYDTGYRSPEWLRTGITKGGETVLHIAAAAMQQKVVEVAINLDPSSLVFTSKDGNTPFCFAAVSGAVKIAKVMHQVNNELPNVRGRRGMTPLHMAVLLGHRDMVWYLLEVTDIKRLTEHDLIEILTRSIDTDLIDVALHILQNHLYLSLLRDARGETPLHALARKPLKPREHQLNIWRIFSFSRCTSEGTESRKALKLTEALWNQVIQQKKEEISASIRQPWRLLFVAARLGKIEFLSVLIRSYPDLIWKVDEHGYSIFHIAVIHRQVEIFKLIYEIGAIKNLIATSKDEKGNNMLHLASELAPLNCLGSVSGAALQMQRELQWFEAVKKIVRPEYAEAENKAKQTPHALFSKQHETLRKQGEEWMKKTSESCAVVAALITTMVFSAAFQLPGGLNNNTGSPVLVKKTSFVFFAMSNAVSLFSSTASILMFLSILTSQYAERDFLLSLPQKLMTGLILLLISIASMVVGYTVTLFITFQEGLAWPPITIAILATVPVMLFALQQFPLLAEMYYSTYKSQNLYLQGHRKLFQAPPTDNSTSILLPERDEDFGSERRYLALGRLVASDIKDMEPSKDTNSP